MRRRRARALLLAGALLFGLLGFGLFPQEPLRRWSEARLRAALGPQVQIGRLHVVPFLLRAEAWDVSVATPTLEARLPHVRVHAAPGLLWGDLSAWRALEFDEPLVVLRAAAPPPSAAPPWRGPLSVARWRVRGGRFTYEGQTRVTLAGLACEGALGQGVLQARAEAGELALPALSRPLSLGPMSARARLTSDLRVDLETLELTSGASRLSASGALGQPGAWSPGLRFAGEVELAEAATLLGGPPVAGRARVSGHVVDDAAGASVELKLAAPELRVADLTLDEAAVDVTRAPSLPWRAVGQARLLGGQASAEATWDEDGTLTLRSTVAQIDARALAPGASGLRARLAGDAHAHGRLGAPLTLRATAAATGSLDGRPLLLDGSASGTFDPSTRRSALRWSARAALSAAGDERLRRVELHGTGRADGVWPAPLVGRVDGHAALRGASDDAPLDVRFAGDLRLAGTRASAQLEGQALAGRFRLTADTRGAHVEALHLSGHALHLAALAPGLRGVATLELQAQGAAARLDGAGRLHVEDAAWGQAPLGALEATLGLARGLPSFEVEAPGLAAHLVGRLEAGALRGTLALRDSPLAVVAALLERPLEGRVTARAELDVPLQAPLDAQVQAHVAALELAQPVAARVLRPFELRHARRRTQISGLELAGAGLQVAAEGSFGGEPQTLDGHASARLDLSAAALPEGARASGTLAADLTLRGSLTQPRADGFVEARGLTAAWPGAPELALDDTRQLLDGDALALQALTLRLAGGRLTLDGRLPWAALLAGARREPARLHDEEQARLTLDWSDVDAAALLRARAPTTADWLQASLAGHAELRGGLRQASELGGAILLPETPLVASDVRMTLAPTRLTLDGGRLSSEALRLTSGDARLDLRGQVDLAQGTLDLQSEGAVDLRVLSPLLGEAAVTGRGELAALVSGALAAPRVTGTLLAHGATLRLRTLRQPLTEIEAWLTFDDRQLELQELSARLGGGTVSGAGRARLDGRRLADVDLRLTGRGVGLHYPAGLRSRLDADLRLVGASGAFKLSGDVRAERGLFDLDAVAEASLFGPAARPQPSPLLRSFALELDVATTQPLRVRRTSASLANLLATARLTLRGDLETPSPRGRVDLIPGGVATMFGRSMLLTSGRLTYDGTWDAALDLHATLDEAIKVKGKDSGRARDDTYDRLDVSGTLDAPRLTLRDQRGEAPLADAQRSLALLAGSGDALASSGGWAAADQAAALLTGRVSRTLSRGLRPLGLDEISIEPQLVAHDVNPGARFTFAKRLTPQARLIYSHSLRDSEDRLVRLEVGPLRTARASVERREAGQFSYAAGQTVDLGARSGDDVTRADVRAPDERVRLGTIELTGDRPLAENALRDALDLDLGQRVGPWDALDAADRLRARLVEAGHLEAEVGAWLDDTRLQVRISAGPRYDVRVDGFAAPRGFEHRLRQALFEDEALERGQAELLRLLIRRGHLRARVTTSVAAQDTGRTLVFEVAPGPRLRLRSARFPGARALASGELLRAAGGLARVLADPAAARQAWLTAYHERFFLAARIDAPRIEEHDGQVTLDVRVDEGARARIASLTLAGGALTPVELGQATGLEAGQLYVEADVVAGAQRLRERFVGLGYPEARVGVELEPRDHDLAVLLRLDTGRRVEIAALDVDGAARTDAGLLRGRTGLVAGQPLDVRALAKAESRLLALGTLSSARLTPDATQPGRLRLEVRERAPLSLDYRLRYDDDEGFNLQTDGELRHLFGRAIVLGGRYRVGRDERDGRAFLNVPLGPGPLTVSASRLSEDLPRNAFAGDTVENLRVQRELRVQQALETFRPWVLLGGYRFKRVTLLPLQPEPLDLAALSLSLVRETRDNPLDPRHGRFYGLDIELAPAWLASDFTFVKGSAQAFFARSRGALTWAQGYRLSLARGLGGQTLTSTERFKAGGAYTVRGFGSEELGPVFLDRATGGEALLVLNQELRWRHPSGLGAAAFYDAGNVYARARELRELKLRHAVGLGLRYASPFGLLRVDFGFPLARRAGEKSWRWFFTFGQAF